MDKLDEMCKCRPIYTIHMKEFIEIITHYWLLDLQLIIISNWRHLSFVPRTHETPINESFEIHFMFYFLFVFVSSISLTKFIKLNDKNETYSMTLYFGPKLCLLFCCKETVKVALSVAQRMLDPRIFSLDIRQRIFP